MFNLVVEDRTEKSVTLDAEMEFVGASRVKYANKENNIEIWLPRGNCNILHIPRIITTTFSIRSR